MEGYAGGGQSSNCEVQHPDGGAAGGQKGAVVDPGPPPTQLQPNWTGPPTNWFIGQWTPATWVNGTVDTWKQVKI
eukprot:1206069-Heterocapsa_arctica.AAC.1